MSGILVDRLRRSPVKGLRQSEVTTLEVAEAGVLDDRRFVLVGENGRVRYGAELDGLANVVAEWDESGRTFTVQGPDGVVVSGPLEFGDVVDVRSTSGRRPISGRRVLGPFDETLSKLAGEPLELLHVEPGIAAPGQITVIGDGSLRRVADAVGLTTLDPMRFRMTIELTGLEPHEEDGWEGRLVRIGSATLRIGGRVPRCVLITRDPTTRVRDLDMLRAILAYREPMETGEAPFGVYATVVEAGRFSVGDATTLVDGL